MFPRINNKSLLECKPVDFKTLLDNPDYRENQYLDYKKTFSFLGAPKNMLQEKNSEFRKDICAFANADGGYIIYGIIEAYGTATELAGVEIDNPDKFELDLRNKLSPIMPQIPPIQFQFVKMENNRYLVITRIERDYYAPYICLEKENNYRIYKRDGNRNTVIGYAELKNMFVQSKVLEDEILRFRNRKVEYYSNIGGRKYESFLLFHMIPESFLNDRKQLFLIERKKKISFRSIFANAKIDSISIPCVDGLRFVNSYGDEEALLYDNGIAEYFLPLESYVKKITDGIFFYSDDVWEYVACIAKDYQKIIPNIFGNQRYFGCISIVGCKGVISEFNDIRRQHTTIDRNKIICQPVGFLDIKDENSFYAGLNRLHLEYLLSIGIKKDEKVQELIEGITQE